MAYLSIALVLLAVFGASVLVERLFGRSRKKMKNPEGLVMFFVLLLPAAYLVYSNVPIDSPLLYAAYGAAGGVSELCAQCFFGASLPRDDSEIKNTIQTPFHIHITSVPSGEAPLWVREQWVGLKLPLAQRKAVPLTFLTSGVLSGPRNLLSCLLALLTGKLERQSGFLVESRAAVAILASQSPEAAAWWREKTPDQLKPGRQFVFLQEDGHVDASSGEA